MNYKEQIKENIDDFNIDFDGLEIDYTFLRRALYRMKKSIEDHSFRDIKYGLCHFIDEIVDSFYMSFAERFKYADFLMYLLPNEGYTVSGIYANGAPYAFPVKDGEFNGENFYHYRLIWLNQLIEISKEKENDNKNKR